MEIHPPVAVIVRVPGLMFNLSDFQRAYPLESNPEDLRIDYIRGGWSVISGFTLDDLDEAFRTASPPVTLLMPTQ